MLVNDEVHAMLEEPIRIERTRLLSEKQVQSYVENGFHVEPGLVTPEELTSLKQDTVDLARGKYPCDSLKPLPADTSDTAALQSILCIHQPHFISPIIREFVLHNGICSVLGQITAAHLPYWDGSVKCMQSMLFVKPPTFQGQAWHQDEVYIPTRDRSLTGAWIAMDDATVENGCLWVVPGSHRNGYLFPQRKHESADEYDFAPESFGFDEALAIPVEVNAGDVVFFNGYLLHKSLKNRSEGYRRVLVSHYMNAWSVLPWSIKEGEHPANADRRAIVPVAGIDPYAWKGLEPEGQNVWLRTCTANTK